MGISARTKSPLSTLRAAPAAAVSRIARIGHRDWAKRLYTMPAPQEVKWAVLARYGAGSDVWIETGTYLGETTAFLAGSGARVISIEPSPDLARAALTRFAEDSGVTILEGLSEVELPKVLESLEGGSVAFWLDGHFSAGITYQGPADTPIREELLAVEAQMAKFDRVVVMVDDVRCFDPSNPEYSQYPTRSWLVDWADRHALIWAIEQDIFVAWN